MTTVLLTILIVAAFMVVMGLGEALFGRRLRGCCSGSGGTSGDDSKRVCTTCGRTKKQASDTQ